MFLIMELWQLLLRMENGENKMIKLDKLERDKRLIKEHKERMFNMRVMGLDWQETHQKRWDKDTLCFDDGCVCEEILNNEKE